MRSSEPSGRRRPLHGFRSAPVPGSCAPPRFEEWQSHNTDTTTVVPLRSPVQNHRVVPSETRPGSLAGWMAERRTRSRLRRVVAALGDARFSAVSRDLLADALGDPSLELGLWVADADGYFDTTGRPVAVPAVGSTQSASFIADADGPLGVLIHDRRLPDDRRLADVIAAAGLGLRNARLQTELRVQLAAVQESRARLLHAADLERARLARAVRSGAERELVSLTQTLRAASATLPSDVRSVAGLVEGAIRQSEATLAELRDLVHGILPRALTEDGLGPALQSLAERARVAVELASAPRERLPLSVEAATYFACSEALTNVDKHARASRATVRATLIEAELVVEVTDDGEGGAQIRPRGGLAGLADRIEALGGTMKIESPSRRGTRLIVRIPVPSATISSDADARPVDRAGARS
jgi:signal transduction histidine kinase